ncbi:ribokinase [Photobacterium kasasachensis]|uniref:ribokinase n=1 Tax=Photobacterium kasasachensis TaxID=2910240 RepID=UPI003D13903A
MKNRVFVFGSYNVDMVSVVEEFPLPGQSVTSKGFNLGSGGKGANQAYSAQQNGADVTFLSKIGTDQFSTYAQKALERCNFYRLHLLKSDEQSTGMANIFVRESDKENFIAINLGANASVTKQEIRRFQPEICESKVLLVQLENNLDAILSTMKIAQKHNVTTILNPAPYSKEVTELLPFTDIITPNETEAKKLTGITIKCLDDAKMAARVLNSIDKIANVVITLGSQGALAYDGQEYHFVESFKASPVDTTGAGDAFNGALATQIAQGTSLADAVRYATAYASLAVERKGAANMPEGSLVAERMGATVR